MLRIIVSLLLVSVAHSHDWGFGPCPSVPPYPNFSVNKFLGRWYVVEEFDTDSKCVTLDFTKNSETSLLITKNRQFSVLDSAGLNHTSSYEGHLDIPLAENQAFMRLKWPLNFVGKADFIVFDTDYTTYAGIYDCQQLSSLMYRHSASIISREELLDDLFVDRVKRRLKSFNVQSSDFKLVDHNDCTDTESSAYKLDFNRYTLSNVYNRTSNVVTGFVSQVANEAANVANTVSDGAVQAVNVVSDGARQVVNTVSDTVRDAANTVSSNVRRMGLVPVNE